MNKFSVKRLNFALWLRNKIRNWTDNPRNYQAFTVKGFFSSFLETFLDLHHQETFSCTIAQNYVKDFGNFNYLNPYIRK